MNIVNKYPLFLVFVITLMLISCRKPVPQLPSNKITDENNPELAMREMNKIMTQREDSAIQVLVNKQPVKYSKTRSGVWYNILQKTTADSLKTDSTVTFSYKMYDLNGQPIKEEKKTIKFGKKEVPTGLEEGLKMMRKGETIRLIVPWYLAYGISGNEGIAPYTSLIYEVKNEK